MIVLRFNNALRAKPVDDAEGFGLSHRAYLHALRAGDDDTIIARSADRALARRWLDRWLPRSRA